MVGHVDLAFGNAQTLEDAPIASENKHLVGRRKIQQILISNEGITLFKFDYDKKFPRKSMWWMWETWPLGKYMLIRAQRNKICGSRANMESNAPDQKQICRNPR